MHYLEIALLSLPVVWGLAYFLRDLRQMPRQRSQPAANLPEADCLTAIGDATAGGVDFGHLDPTIEHAAGEAAHAAAVDVGAAIEQVGHWLHH